MNLIQVILLYLQVHPCCLWESWWEISNFYLFKSCWLLSDSFTRYRLSVLSQVQLWEPMDCNPPGSSVQGLFQAKILKWVAISSSRGSYQPRDWTWVSCIFCIGRHILYHWAPWEPQPVKFSFLCYTVGSCFSILRAMLYMLIANF